MAEGQEVSNKITITVKTPKSKETITIDENAEIKDVSIFIIYSISNFNGVIRKMVYEIGVAVAVSLLYTT